MAASPAASPHRTDSPGYPEQTALPGITATMITSPFSLHRSHQPLQKRVNHILQQQRRLPRKTIPTGHRYSRRRCPSSRSRRCSPIAAGPSACLSRNPAASSSPPHPSAEIVKHPQRTCLSAGWSSAPPAPPQIRISVSTARKVIPTLDKMPEVNPVKQQFINEPEDPPGREHHQQHSSPDRSSRDRSFHPAHLPFTRRTSSVIIVYHILSKIVQNHRWIFPEIH